MSLLPPMQPWEAAHPIVVHFPIVMLLIAWVPMAVGVVDKPRRVAWMVAALLLLAGGTAGAFVAVMSGEATHDTVGAMSVAAERAIHEHEEMGELTRTLFVVVTALFVVVLGLAAGLKKGTARRVAVGVGAGVFLGLYGYSATRLAWTAHMGGELVHVHGVRASMKPAPGPAPGDEQGGDEDE